MLLMALGHTDYPIETPTCQGMTLPSHDNGRSWGKPGYLPLQDDISSVAFWYQTLSTSPFPPLADKDALEII